MSVATMSRQTKRAYLRLCPEKTIKKNQDERAKEVFASREDGGESMANVD